MSRFTAQGSNLHREISRPAESLTPRLNKLPHEFSRSRKLAMRVLVIEDEQKMADLIKRGLEEEGMEVETAYDGDVGFEAGKSENIDLIILDLALPGRTAWTWRVTGVSWESKRRF